jgi:mono/diheme cytochrome c family protein
MRLLWIALAAFTCGASADEPSAAVERGRYVATAANCVSCAYPGQWCRIRRRPLDRDALGPIHSTNITPDRQTGIGSWTEEDLKRALREGIAADGRHLFPAFPYPYTRLADGDIADLYAFLRTLKPIHYVPPENGSAFRMRWPMATWKALNLVVGAYRPDAARGAEWNRGAYLVQGPGHCGACHTPRDWSLATPSSDPLRGAVMQGEVKSGVLRDWFAVDLRATTQGLAGWKTEDIVDYLAKGASARLAASVR